MKIRNSHLILFAILLFSLAIRIPAFFIPHLENDEVIYEKLADQVSKSPLNYTLRGTDILSQLPKMNYDQPLFHRPPLFVYLLAIVRGVFGKPWGIILPILFGTLTVLAVFGVAREWYGEKQGLISALVVASCPLLLFASYRILIDSQLVFLITLAVWAFLVALRRNSRLLFSASGIILGLAILTKEPAVIMVITCAYIIFRGGFSKERVVNFLCFLLCAFLVTLPWYYWFYSTYRTLIPLWAKFYPENFQMFPFVRMVVDRPWYFYLKNISLAMPIYIFAWVSIGINLKKKMAKPEIVWALVYLGVITLYGIMGQGYQTRYILPIVPALAILAAEVLNNRNKIVLGVGITLLGLSFLTGILNSLIFKPADIWPFFSFFAGIK